VENSAGIPVDFSLHDTENLGAPSGLIAGVSYCRLITEWKRKMVLPVYERIHVMYVLANKHQALMQIQSCNFPQFDTLA
jgi:hypothetical protein